MSDDPPTPESLADRLSRSLPEFTRFVRRRMGRELESKESASDIAQSTARELWNSADFEDRGEASLQRWLRVAAEHKIKNRARHWRAFGRQSLQSLDALDGWAGAGRAETPSEDLMLREERERLDRALSALPAEYRTVIRRVQIDGADYAEVARELQRSPEAVRKLLARALARLATLLRLPAAD